MQNVQSHTHPSAEELLDLLNRIKKECTPGVSGYYVIVRMIDEVLNEYRKN